MLHCGNEPLLQKYLYKPLVSVTKPADSSQSSRIWLSAQYLNL